MKYPDENPLLKEILADEKLSQLRQTSLEDALGAMRRQRRQHQAIRVGAFVLLPLAALMLGIVLRQSEKTANTPQIVAQATHPSTMVVPPEQESVQMISDEELFALFPDQPVALIGKPGQQEFVILNTRTSNGKN